MSTEILADRVCVDCGNLFSPVNKKRIRCPACWSALQHKYYVKAKDRYAEKRKRYRANNRKHVNELQRLWRKKNIEKVRQQEKQRRFEKSLKIAAFDRISQQEQFLSAVSLAS